MSLPTNPCGPVLCPYQRHPYCKLPDPEHAQWVDHDADTRGLKMRREGVQIGAKWPADEIPRNAGCGTWRQGRQRVHWSCNRAKPNTPRAFSETGMTLEQFAAAWTPVGWAHDYTKPGKAKPSDPWCPPGARA